MRLVYVGIDAAKESHMAEVGDRVGNTLLPAFPFAADLEGIEYMLARMREVTEKLGAVPVFGMEATGIYHLGLYSELRSRGYTVKTYNPLQLRAFRKKALRKTYTDKTSCSAIVEMLRYENIPIERNVPPEVLKLREYTRARHRLVKKIAKAKTQVKRDLSVIFPGYDRLFKDSFCKSSRRLLKEFTTPEALLELGEEKLAYILQEESGGNLGVSKARKVLEECRRTAAPEHMDEPCVYELRMLIDQIELLEDQVEGIDTKIEEFFSTFEESELYTSIDGVAKVTAAAIHANFGPMTDFPHPDKAVAFAGLDPSIVESGKFIGSEHHISKRGSPYLRAALYQAANTAVRCNPVLSKAYRKKRREGLSHKAAVCVAARKLVRILHSIAVNRKPFYVPANISS